MTPGNKVHGTKTAGAPFNVYLRKAAAGNGMQAATYAVKPGDTLHKQFPLSLFANAKYSIDVHGPNGFIVPSTVIRLRARCRFIPSMKRSGHA